MPKLSHDSKIRAAAILRLKELEDSEEEERYTLWWANMQAEHPDLADRPMPLLNKYIRQLPHYKQCLALTDTHREVFYGGAGGPGKSSALLMWMLGPVVRYPEYAGIILRKRFSDLGKSGALLERCRQWLNGTDAKWHDRDKRWTFPSGASVSFGYLTRAADRDQYQSAEYHRVAMDELSQFEEDDYLYMFSRQRRSKTMNLPIQTMSGSNPGNIGHLWVKKRFITDPTSSRIFYPAKMADNPYIDIADYEASLEEVNPVLKEQIKNGDWDVVENGTMFKAYWPIKFVDSAPRDLRLFTYWDVAATTSTSSDCSATLTGGVDTVEDEFYLMDGDMFKAEVPDVRAAIKNKMLRQGPAVRVGVEANAFQVGVIQDLQRDSDLTRFDFVGVPSHKDKVTRAIPLQNWHRKGKLVIVRGEWTTQFLEQLFLFPIGAMDDFVDAGTGVEQMSAKDLASSTNAIESLMDTCDKCNSRMRLWRKYPWDAENYRCEKCYGLSGGEWLDCDKCKTFLRPWRSDYEAERLRCPRCFSIGDGRWLDEYD